MCVCVCVCGRGDITVEVGNTNAKVAFKSCTLFKNYWADINNVFVDEADYACIVIHVYNLLKYSDNYFDISESLWQFNRDEPQGNADLTFITLRLHTALIHSNVNQIL